MNEERRAVPGAADRVRRETATRRAWSAAAMGEAMLRTSFSEILNSSRDFSTAITDAGGRRVAQAEDIPGHVGAMPAAVRATREVFGDDIRPGDVCLRNDPSFGCGRRPDRGDDPDRGRRGPLRPGRGGRRCAYGASGGRRPGPARRRREISSAGSRPERNGCLAHPTSKGVKNATSITIAAIIQSPSTRR